MAKPFISIIVPVQNEEERLPLTLLDMDMHLSNEKFSYEILVVVAQSIDRTEEIAMRFSEILKKVKVLTLGSNYGNGKMIKEGVLAARGNYRLVADVDNAVSLDHIAKILPLLKEDVDVILCSRALKESKVLPGVSMFKKLWIKLNSFIARKILSISQKDFWCNYRIYAEDAAKKIFTRSLLNNRSLDIESIMLADRFGFRIKEVPSTWVSDPMSKVGFKEYIRLVMGVIKIRMNLWFGKYKII